MLQKVIVVYDKKIGLYEKPFICRHSGEAIREWDYVIKDTKTKFGQNPQDFDLFEVGTYDDQTATFRNLDTPLHLAAGV